MDLFTQAYLHKQI